MGIFIRLIIFMVIGGFIIYKDTEDDWGGPDWGLVVLLGGFIGTAVFGILAFFVFAFSSTTYERDIPLASFERVNSGGYTYVLKEDGKDHLVSSDDANLNVIGPKESTPITARYRVEYMPKNVFTMFIGYNYIENTDKLSDSEVIEEGSLVRFNVKPENLE